MTPEEESLLAQLEAAVHVARQHVADAQKQLRILEKEWEEQFRAQLERQVEMWVPLTPSEVTSAGGATLARQEDGSWLVGGTNPANDIYTITAPLAAGPFSGLLVEVLPDVSLPGQSLGRHSKGNFVLSGVEVEIAAPSLSKQLVADFTRAEADYEQKHFEVKLIVDKNSPTKKGWAVDGNDPARRQPRKASFVTDAPLTVPAEATIVVRLRHESVYAHHNIGRFRLSVTSLPPALVTLDGGAPHSPRSIHVPTVSGPGRRKQIPGNQPVMEVPWITEQATEFLKQYLAEVSERRPPRVLEFGSGGSTIWYATRQCVLCSVEHDGEWYKAVRARVDQLVAEHRIAAIDYRLHARPYYELTDGPVDLDLLFVDGRDRVRCVANNLQRLRPGGVLMLDNAERAYYAAVGNTYCKGWQYTTTLQLMPHPQYGTHNPKWRTDWWIKPLHLQ